MHTHTHPYVESILKTHKSGGVLKQKWDLVDLNSHSIGRIKEYSFKTIVPDQCFLKHVLQNINLMKYLEEKKVSWLNTFGKLWIFYLCLEIDSYLLVDKKLEVLEGGETTFNS